MKKGVFRISVFIIVLYGLLLIPGNNTINIESEGNSTPFIWDADEKWNQLENQFNEYKNSDRQELISQQNVLIQNIEGLLDNLEIEGFQPDDPKLDILLNQFFELSSMVAALDDGTEKLTDIYSRARRLIKSESVNWEVDEIKTRISLYKMIYGMRAAVEEVLLQSSADFNPVLFVSEEASQSPYTEIMGIKVHSGDLLVSRGGAEVSALISRGNDYPGNFSHVALLYIDDESNTPYLIESLIERGVVLTTAEEYVKDKKLRFMVLRPRADLPIIQENPLLPHLAAKTMFEESQQRHIPYDFKMNFFEPSAMFCSEVGSFAYKSQGVQIWQSESTIFSMGIVKLLNTFGVENFVTQMPSDLEYDPQLSVIAEWRNPDTLMDDHVYNAVIDAMLICAEKGEEIEYNAFLLPAGRLIKAYSFIKNQFNTEGPIPEGMNATQALKSDAFINRHAALKEDVLNQVESFRAVNNYSPPYWELFEMAQNASQCQVTD